MIDLIKLELLYRKYRNGLRDNGKSYKFTSLKTFIACCFPLLDFILTEQVACQSLVVDGDERHRPERADVQPDGVCAAVFVRAQEISKSEIKTGISSFKAMSFTW